MQLHSLQTNDVEVAYRASLFTVNGQTVGVTPEVVARVTDETSWEELDSVCKTMGLRRLRPMPFTTREYVLEVLDADAGAVFSAVRTLKQTDGIEWAWPNLILYGDPEPVDESEGLHSLVPATPATTKLAGDVPEGNTFMEPNDPFFSRQWHLHNTGQTGGTPGADINALAAWEITTGDPNIVVAVIDSGVDMNHPDLATSLVSGYDFWDDDDCPQSLSNPDNAHGTMCAGLISAQGNNSIGVAGVAWNCKLMPVRIDLWPSVVTSSEEATIATALRWAAHNGADVISNSWFFHSPLPIIHSAIKDISQSGGGMGRDGKGCIVVFAGGNEGTRMKDYPERYPEVITVGGTDVDDRRLSYSNFGPELDIVAPSGSQPYSSEGWVHKLIWSTDISGPLGWNAVSAGYAYPHIHDYAHANGTSVASPQVAGVAALILSIEPDLTNEEVRHYLTRSAKDLGDPGWDKYHGWGRLDARAALDMVLAQRADLNLDGIVDDSDLSLLQEHLDVNDPMGDIAPAAKRDGVVDHQDLDLFMQYLYTEIPEPGLIAHWRLDETEGMFAADNIGGNQGVVLGNPIWRPEGGQMKGALEFDGIDDVIILKPVLNPKDGPFSVFAWVKGGAPGQAILSQQTGVNWLQVDVDGTLMTELAKLGGRINGSPLYSETVITDENWHRVGFVWNGAQRILYVDDIPVALDDQGSLGGATGGLVIGTGNQAGTFWQGLIDDVRIYDRVVVP